MDTNEETAAPSMPSPVQPAVTATEPAAAKPTPVMDVVPPRTDPAPAPAPAAEIAEPPAADPAPDAAAEAPLAEPPAEESPENLIDQESHPEAHDEPPAQPVGTPKHPSNGVTTAVVGTVIIIVVLAALAVFAYMQTNK